MADRYFPNEMPDFVSEASAPQFDGSKDSLTNLLSLPYTTLSQRLLRLALDLKDTVMMTILTLIAHNYALFSMVLEKLFLFS